MPTKIYTETTALICDENNCYKLKDILRNPNNKCDKDVCKKIESDYADFMHLSIPAAYFYANAMHDSLLNYEEQTPHQVAVIIDEKIYSRLIEPSLEEDTKKKTNTSNKNVTKKKYRKGANKKTKKNTKN